MAFPTYDVVKNEDGTLTITSGKSPVRNAGQLLIHLNGQNWGLWKLPKMNVDYKCNQHDCDGKPATTIILAEPVSCDGIMTSRFCIGAPAKYLNDYYKFRY